jgi:hypothetical protein
MVNVLPWPSSLKGLRGLATMLGFLEEPGLLQSKGGLVGKGLNERDLCRAKHATRERQWSRPDRRAVTRWNLA